ncbi:MAG: hypothetical protein QF615_09605, partial [Planctomycetota bacterium]|nr:hypothetical protein [Planctomycetota bacterium]
MASRELKRGQDQGASAGRVPLTRPWGMLPHDLLLGGLLVCGTLSSAAAATPQENAVRSFSIHDTRSSAAAWDAAEEHIAAARWSEAL